MKTRLGAVEMKGGYSLLLCAPDEYWEMTPAERKKICNGCGTAHSGWMIPDTLWLTDITVACDCHDAAYYFGKTIEDKEQADREFLNNMLRLCEKAPSSRLFLVGPVLTMLRRRRALKYYEAVMLLGGPAFWQGK